MDLREKEVLVEKYQGMVWKTIHRNRVLVCALQLEDEDVFQDLMIVLLKALNKFDPNRGCSMDKYIAHKLQFGLLTIKRQHKPHGVTGLQGRRLNFDFLDDAGETGMTREAPVMDNTNDIEYQDAINILTPAEREAVRMRMEGIFLRRNAHKDAFACARRKLMKHYYFEGGDALGAAQAAIC